MKNNNYKNKSWGGNTNTGFYRRKDWRSLREIKINQNPLCELCQSINIITPAVYVDHILNRNLFKEYELENNNLQSLCPTCHAQKTRLELMFENREAYLKEFDSGKLQYICTNEAKERLLNLLAVK